MDAQRDHTTCPMCHAPLDEKQFDEFEFARQDAKFEIRDNF